MKTLTLINVKVVMRVTIISKLLRERSQQLSQPQLNFSFWTATQMDSHQLKCLYQNINQSKSNFLRYYKYYEYRRQSSCVHAKWEPITKEQAIRGIYNFKEEIEKMRLFLDKMHNKHERANHWELPEGYI